MTGHPIAPQEYTHILDRASVAKVDVDGLAVLLYRWGGWAGMFRFATRRLWLLGALD